MRKKKPIFTFKNLDRKKYRVFERRQKGNDAGFCESPNEPKPRIVLDPTLGPKIRMRLVIEEFGHAFWYDDKKLKEWEIRKFAKTVTKFLYGEGWRLKKSR